MNKFKRERDVGQMSVAGPLSEQKFTSTASWFKRLHLWVVFDII